MTMQEILGKLEKTAEECLSLHLGEITDAKSTGGTGQPLFPHLEGVVVDMEGNPLDQGDEIHIKGGEEGGMTPTQWVSAQRAARVAHQRGRFERGVLDAHQERVAIDEARLVEMGVVPFHSPKKGVDYAPTPPEALVPDNFRGAPLIVGGVEEPWENHADGGFDDFWEGPTPHQRYLATIDPPTRERVEPTQITARPTGEVYDTHQWGGVGDDGPPTQKGLAE